MLGTQSVLFSSVPGKIKTDPTMSQLQEKPYSATDFLCDLGQVPVIFGPPFLLYSGRGGQVA